MEGPFAAKLLEPWLHLAALWGGFGILTALKALGRGPGRPPGGSWKGPPAAPTKKHEADHVFGVLIYLRHRGGPVWPAPNECSRKGEHGL